MIWLVQLVFDCTDPDAVMQFWGQALEYRNPFIGIPAEEVAAFRAANPQFDGRGRIDDNELRRMPVYIQHVPEPKRERNRVRLELAATDRSDAERRLQGLGAQRVAHEEFTDVEGNEFTIVHADEGQTRLRSIVIDADDPERLLAFWADATGYMRDAELPRCDPIDVGVRWEGTHFVVNGEVLLHITGAGAEPAPAPFDLVPGFEFRPATAAKQKKNRLHVDLNSTDVDADRKRLVSLGATVLQWDIDHVLADPEGNEFCLSGRTP